MLTFSVRLRNRRKWSTPSASAIRVQSYAGVDTFRISCWSQFSTVNGVFPHEDFIKALHAKQEELRQGKATTGTVEMFGESFSVNRSGSTKGDDGKKGPYYPYVFTWRGIRFEMQPFHEAKKTTPNVIVYAASVPLTAKGGEWSAVWDEARYCLESILRGCITRTAVGRLDIFIDVPDQTVADYCRLFAAGSFVRRSRKWEVHAGAANITAQIVQSYLDMDRKELECRIIGKGFGKNGLQPTGLYLGGSGVLCRIYDKLRELEDKEDYIKFQSMQHAYWNGGQPKELVRIEFQLKTRQLRECGIEDVHSLHRGLRALVSWLCESWLVVRQKGVDRHNSKRYRIHSHWQEVIDAASSRFGRGDGRKLPPIDRTPAAPENLLDQAIGCLSSYLAKGDYPGSLREMVDQLQDAVLVGANRIGLNTCFDRIKERVYDHHARVGSSLMVLDRRPPPVYGGDGAELLELPSLVRAGPDDGRDSDLDFARPDGLADLDLADEGACLIWPDPEEGQA